MLKFIIVDPQSLEFYMMMLLTHRTREFATPAELDSHNVPFITVQFNGFFIGYIFFSFQTASFQVVKSILTRKGDHPHVNR
ncbi:hypothetical protein JY97_05025 [Alkalispirochaeta odontotermitis]|nr:hypothetical protein JY97_05025 [Alkalispirochaeta odontotermitis]CAB1081529.1 hypothetical protein D1AOALGA4SA_9179 [Olavius algarvensis Delta 1 endosymbiont]